MLRKTRDEREQLEHELLASEATKADESDGRAEDEEPDEFRTAFERDRDRIVHTKAFRRLKHKTQVFLNPDGDHFVTRMTHTIQVNQVGRAMARPSASTRISPRRSASAMTWAIRRSGTPERTPCAR